MNDDSTNPDEGWLTIDQPNHCDVMRTTLIMDDRVLIEFGHRTPYGIATVVRIFCSPDNAAAFGGSLLSSYG